MQQCLPSMTIAGMKEFNGVIKEVVRKDPVLIYLQPSKEEQRNARLIAFSDARFPHRGKLKKVSQESCLMGVSLGKRKRIIFPTMSWFYRKKRRVSNSSGQAEAISAVNGPSTLSQFGATQKRKSSDYSRGGQSWFASLAGDAISAAG
eukprot:IDg8723t1